MEERFKCALTEIYEILLYIDQEALDEIPFEVVYKITENKSKNYEFKIDTNEQELGKIIENKIREETKEILAYLYLEYWCKKEDEKLKEELEAMRETMKLQGIYNIFTLDMKDIDIYKNTLQEDEINEEVKMAGNMQLTKIEKESIFEKIKNMLIKLFNKFKKNK